MKRFVICSAAVIGMWTMAPQCAHADGDAMGLYLQGLQHASDGESEAAIEDLTAAATLDSTAAEIPRELARVLLDARRLDEALPMAQRAQRLAPDDPDANGILGQIYMLRQEPNLALESLDRAHRLDPGNRSRVISLVIAYEALGRNEEALALLSPERGGTPPDSPLLLMHRGILRARMNRSKEALDDYLAAMRLAPDFPGLVDQIIATSWRAGPSDSTAAVCLRALDLAPDRNDLRRESARILITLGRQLESVPLLERLHKDDPRDASITMQLGVIRFGQDRLDEAIPLLEDARSKDPSLQDSDDWMWRAYNRADSLRSALRVADRMILDAPADRKGHWYRALSLARLGMTDSALTELGVVLRIVPGDRDAGLLQALILVEQGRFDDARAGLERMAEEYPEDREVLFRLGNLEQRAGRALEAVTWYRRLLEKRPDDAAALNEAGYLLADEGVDLEQALAWTSRAVQLEPENPAYLDSYGWALFRLERYQEAIDPLRRAGEKDPKEPLLKIHLAKALHAAGREEEGKRVLRELLQGQPNERQARELLQVWEMDRSNPGNPR